MHFFRVNFSKAKELISNPTTPYTMYPSSTGVDVETKFMAKWIVKKWCWQFRVPGRKKPNLLTVVMKHLTETVWQRKSLLCPPFPGSDSTMAGQAWCHNSDYIMVSQEAKGGCCHFRDLFFSPFILPRTPAHGTVSPIILPPLIISANRCLQRCASSVRQVIPSLDVKGYFMGWLRALAWRFIMVDRCLRPLTVFWSLPFND